MINWRQPVYTSVLIHAAFLVSLLLLINLKTVPQATIEIPVEVIAPKEVQNLNEVKEKQKIVIKSVNPVAAKNTGKREVFGLNRNSYTDDSSSAESIAVKKGNTVAVAPDSRQLTDEDADSLPSPTEEYLVSQMPSVLSEVRPQYPAQAKAQNLEGTVVLDVLIDDQGKVRQVSVIEGPEIFREGAIAAMKAFVFKPANVNGNPVAVRIRYSLKFQLEY